MKTICILLLGPIMIITLGCEKQGSASIEDPSCLDSLSNGWHTIKVRVTDTSGNIAEQDRNIYVDNPKICN